MKLCRTGRRGHWLIAAGVVAAVAVSGPSRAAEIEASAGRAESLLTAGDEAEALKALDGAVEAFWEKTPLFFRSTVLIDRFDGYAAFEPHAGNSYAAGEKLMAYLVPVGFGWLPDGAGFRTSVAADLEIRSAKGIVYARADDFARFERRTRTRSKEFCMVVELALPDLKPGDYVAVVTARDEATGKSAAANLPFTITD